LSKNRTDFPPAKHRKIGAGKPRLKNKFERISCLHAAACHPLLAHPHVLANRPQCEPRSGCNPVAKRLKSHRSSAFADRARKTSGIYELAVYGGFIFFRPDLLSGLSP
jgi:hypothetical protein